MAIARNGVERELFPALGRLIGGCALVCTIVSLIITDFARVGDVSRFAHAAWSAGLGAILGLFLGLSRGVWHGGDVSRTSEPAPAPDQLWDPWLDSGHEVPEADSEPAVVGDAEETSAHVSPPVGLAPERARVRPRIISPVTGEAIPLDETIGQLIEEGKHKFVRLVGGPGSGKTTAMRHLAAVLPPWALDQVRLLYDPVGCADIVGGEGKDGRVIITATDKCPPAPHRVTYSLAPWGQDDLIEYLLSAHWERCSGVMARLKASHDRGFLKGIPELWTVALDRMARDESIADVRTAIRCALTEWFAKHTRAKAIAEDFCLTGLGKNDDPVLNFPLSAMSGATPGREQDAWDLLRLVRHRPVALLLAADRIKDIAERGRVEPELCRQLSRDLVEEAGQRIAANTLVLRHLHEWLNRDECRDVHPTAASLLHAAVPDWRPSPGSRPRLSGAYLAKANWRGVNLSQVHLDSADFCEADLSAAILDGARARQAQFRRAKLPRASLDSWIADDADLSGADLGYVRAARAQFLGANLAGARLIEANLWKADLRRARIENADFTGANLEDAALCGLKLRLARFDFARFGGADLRECDLEDMVLTVPDFHDADLRGALFTGSRMEEANFVGADLRGAGLAEIDWPGADLHDADLRDATFHLGSSRSGLVGSPIACEGSRTGFYTDDYDDQMIKSPEEIRKANLRGADLRGANVDDVDFYLVDLRDAKYSRGQADHFRRCRAILESRVT